MASSTQSIFSVQREISKLLNSLNQTKFLQQPKNPRIGKSTNNINNLDVYSPHFEEYTFQYGCQKCPVHLCDECLKAPNLPEMPQVHRAHAREG
ncbi:hypothetical protein V1292_004458 [Bradyrhizobium sp. AZCC 1719]|uniref:hypothetical protein n=1 Tax=Bradyrhizobium sp. AZCC 1719 TaxID=3117028 RepID=UPI002FF2616A